MLAYAEIKFDLFYANKHHSTVEIYQIHSKLIVCSHSPEPFFLLITLVTLAKEASPN